MGGRGGSSHRATGGGGNLQNLTTVDQVNQWLRNQNWFAPYSRVSLNGIDIAAARGIAEAYKQVFDRYPQLKGFFNGVVSFSLGSGTYADCSLSSGTIRVSDSMYRSVTTLRQQYASDIRSNWHPVGTDWSAIVTHEIGHAIDGYITQRMRLSDASYSDWDFNSKTLRGKIAAKLGVSTDSASIAREVSRYGATKSVEWFAESFAEGMHSDTPRRMAKEFMAELDKILRRLR